MLNEAPHATLRSLTEVRFHGLLILRLFGLQVERLALLLRRKCGRGLRPLRNAILYECKPQELSREERNHGIGGQCPKFEPAARESFPMTAARRTPHCVQAASLSSKLIQQ